MKRATVDYDALATSAPLNRDAAIARDGSGEHFDFRVKDGRIHMDAPPPTKPAPHGAPDLTGIIFGRMRVIGYYGSNQKGGLWLSRCTCGAYETRRAKAIRNPVNTDDCCAKCTQLDRMRQREYFRMTGKNKVSGRPETI